VIASDVMTPDPATVSPEATIGEAAQVMRDLNVRHLPVVADGVLVGMLSERDLLSVAEGGRAREEMSRPLEAHLATAVERIMTSDVVAVESDTDLSEVVGLIIEHRIGAVPVLRPGSWELVGIVSYVDVLRAVQGLFGHG